MLQNWLAEKFAERAVAIVTASICLDLVFNLRALLIPLFTQLCQASMRDAPADLPDGCTCAPPPPPPPRSPYGQCDNHTADHLRPHWYLLIHTCPASALGILLRLRALATHTSHVLLAFIILVPVHCSTER